MALAGRLYREVPELVDALPDDPTIPKPKEERMFPLRRTPVNEAAAAELSARHLTLLYNSAPKWLQTRHMQGRKQRERQRRLWIRETLFKECRDEPRSASKR